MHSFSKLIRALFPALPLAVSHSQELGELPIGRLLVQQSVPASIGFIVMSIYGIIDTIFVGRYVGHIGIAAITVVMPIGFLISTAGMAIGSGGASMIARALGADDEEHALRILGNMVVLTLIGGAAAVVTGIIFEDFVLQLFGGRGEVLPAARTYFAILLVGIPFLAWAMMSNAVIRAEGEASVAMKVMLVPALVNLVLDPLFIVYFEWGLAGAAWATTFSYAASALFTFWFIEFGDSELRIRLKYFGLKPAICSEIISLGSVSLLSQGAISVLSVILNNQLVHLGGQLALASYGIVQKILMLFQGPLFGISVGFLPIAGYNIGAHKPKRVWQALWGSVIGGTLVAAVLLAMVYVGADWICGWFTADAELIAAASAPMRILFLASPLIMLQMSVASYYQAAGKAIPAAILSVLRRGVILITLLLVLPYWFGLDGVWIAFPLADSIAAVICLPILLRVRRGLVNAA